MVVGFWEATQTPLIYPPISCAHKKQPFNKISESSQAKREPFSAKTTTHRQHNNIIVILRKMEDQLLQTEEGAAPSQAGSTPGTTTMTTEVVTDVQQPQQQQPQLLPPQPQQEPLAHVPIQEEAQAQGASLLDRIRAQREREAEADVNAMNVGSGPVNIPNYSPISQNPFEGGGGSSGEFNGDSSFGFSSFSMSMGGMFSPVSGAAERDVEASQSLLSDYRGISNDDYSMAAYGHMFIMDIYNCFCSLPKIAQGLLVFFLLWLAWKLI